jgi:hypothetical protein
MKHRVSCYVKCPFYRCEEDQRVYCEGVQKGTALHLVFGSHQALRRYKDRRCKADWGGCMIAKMLNRKYEA